MRAALVPLALTMFSSAAYAGEAARPPRWALRTSEPQVQALLWGPAPQKGDQKGKQKVKLVEYTGHAVAMFPFPKRALVLTLTSEEFRGGDRGEGARLTLLQSGKPALTLKPEELPKGSPLTPCARSGRIVLTFAAEALTADGVRLSMPRPDGAPLVVEFFRVSRAAQDAERELTAWGRHARKILHVSALQPYLSHPSVAALRKRDEAVLVPLLLKELARTAPKHQTDPTAVPRFAVWAVLADTAWGKTHKLGAGDPDEVLGVLSDWRRANAPRIAGVVEPRQLVKSPDELSKAKR